MSDTQVYYIVTWGVNPGSDIVHHVLLDILPCDHWFEKTETHIYGLGLSIWGVMKIKEPDMNWLPRNAFEQRYGTVRYP